MKPATYPQQAKKRFGQHFLHDRSVIERMLKALALQPEDRVVEIGPGPGALTLPLLARLQRLDVVEIDRDLIAWWQQHPEAQGKLQIHAQDALKLELAPLVQDSSTRLRIVGNLPYNISTPLLFHLLGQRRQIRDMLFMLQKEVVDRIIASPGSRDYGRLSVMIQYYCQVARLLHVGPGAFTPPPKVDSAVVWLQPKAVPELAARDEAAFAALVAQAFSQRRKTLRNTLKPLLSASRIEQAGINPGCRAETLTLNDFVRLSYQLPDAGGNPSGPPDT
ncbi:MAG: 16S rRNA (adenine(1518)-N(6)/adenine(1519)-N(6))-dimethyltransferase RsmA [Thiothrix sp.]|nr:16S rRNA (adenine(1518)-N(6)/adenine(1519)-N(6))-dimethyltransferase RsmA [Thiothrix sp.]HPQ96628.1 16S rRNA (adenine(1518)-N(6)/adenine(1519)-N(6))-dimethyltransferase RsmA [Thiolinea sp.]